MRTYQFGGRPISIGVADTRLIVCAKFNDDPGSGIPGESAVGFGRVGRDFVTSYINRIDDRHCSPGPSDELADLFAGDIANDGARVLFAAREGFGKMKRLTRVNLRRHGRRIGIHNSFDQHRAFG